MTTAGPAGLAAGAAGSDNLTIDWVAGPCASERAQVTNRATRGIVQPPIVATTGTPASPASKSL